MVLLSSNLAVTCMTDMYTCKYTALVRLRVIFFQSRAVLLFHATRHTQQICLNKMWPILSRGAQSAAALSLFRARQREALRTASQKVGCFLVEAASPQHRQSERLLCTVPKCARSLASTFKFKFKHNTSVSYASPIVVCSERIWLTPDAPAAPVHFKQIQLVS